MRGSRELADSFIRWVENHVANPENNVEFVARNGTKKKDPEEGQEWAEHELDGTHSLDIDVTPFVE